MLAGVRPRLMALSRVIPARQSVLSRVPLRTSTTPASSLFPTKISSEYPEFPSSYPTDAIADPFPNHHTRVSTEALKARIARKYARPSADSAAVIPSEISSTEWDVVVIGAGHNGLIAANYLADAGQKVLVLERRHTVGGAAVTEELVPGFKFSRASYLAGLLRPQIIKDFELEKYGFEYLVRDPSSFTPTLPGSPSAGKYLLLGSDDAATAASISQFSARDAAAYPQYEEFLSRAREVVQPLLDFPLLSPVSHNPLDRKQTFRCARALASAAWKHRSDLPALWELLTAPAAQILDRWFEGDVLKATLATDAVIGAAVSPRTGGSAYVLLHHVMGEAAGRKGVWAYVRGGMGAITQALAARGREKGVTIVENCVVDSIDCAPNTRVTAKAKMGGKKALVDGVTLADGTKIRAKKVLSNATPYHTFLELMPELTIATGGESASKGASKESDSVLPKDFTDHLRFADYACGALKINCAVNKLPDFFCKRNGPDGKPGPQHRGTIHFEDKIDDIDAAYRETLQGRPASRPVIEMTIPSALDNTVAPAGSHVVQLFVQYAPYELSAAAGGSWEDPKFKEAYADHIFKIIDQYCDGFSASVIGRDVLSPLDLERIFGLHKGNIMHGALSLSQLAIARPAPGFADHRTPVDGLYLCGAGAHPGGGVMGAAGRNCATVVLNDVKARL